MRAYLPESADSMLVNTRTFRDAASKEVLLRFRIDCAVRLLFGDRIFIPEGWALDSIVFIKVAAEIIDAAGRLQGSGPLAHSGALPSLFRVEARSGGSQLARYRAYAARGNCEWSGFPSWRDREFERKVGASLAKLARGKRDPERTARCFADLDIPEGIAKGIATVSAYLDDPRWTGERLAAGGMPKKGFLEDVTPLLRELQRLFAAGVEMEAAAQLGNLIDEGSRDYERFRSSSQARVLARRHLDGRPLEAFDYLTRVHFMETATRNEAAAWSGPIYCRARQPLLTDADSSMLALGHSCSLADYEAPGRADTKLGSALAGIVDWKEIWSSVLDLATQKEWKALVAAVRSDSGHVTERLCNSSGFRALEKMLRANCPMLVLIENRGERIGLGVLGRLGLLDKADKLASLGRLGAKAGDIAIASSVVAAPLFFFAPAAAAAGPGWAMAGSAATGTAAQEAAKLYMPLQGGHRVTSSVFRLSARAA